MDHLKSVLPVQGICYLTGCGPGHPGLLTLQAVEVLRAAEVVVYDNLINEHVLSYASPAAERIYVGKRAGVHELRQDKINNLLIELVRNGKTVVRLKGGDPFIFGRGGEEAEALQNAGLRFAIVPGITAGIAAPTFAGIPLTQRGCADSVLFITGHSGQSTVSAAGSAAPWQHTDWRLLVSLKKTSLVIYMGVTHLPEIVKALLQAGREGDTPAALIQWGAQPAQRSVISDLAHICDAVRDGKFSSPAIVVIGAVAAWGDRLSWYKPGPLSGKRCLITRTREQNSRLRQLLTAQGADVVELPMIQIQPIPQVDIPADLARRYEWLIFTSPNGVEYFFKHWHRAHDIRQLGTIQIAAVGAATAEELKHFGLRVDYMPSVYTAEQLCAEWPQREKPGRALHVCGNLAQDSVVGHLTKLGWQVDRLVVYLTVEAIGAAERYRDILRFAPPDWVIFCSGSSVQHFAKVTAGQLPPGLQVASIGRVTSAVVQQQGWAVGLEASVSRLEIMVAELVERVAREQKTDH